MGLIPQDALIDAAQWYTQLDTFEPEQVLEQRLFNEIQTNGNGEKPVDFLEELASVNPTPGGGSAAAYSVAMGAALSSMVGRLTTGRKKYIEVESQMWNLIERSEKLRMELSEAVKEDSLAFVQVMNAYGLPKITEEDIILRDKKIQESMAHAAHIPLKVARKALEVMQNAFEAASLGNTNAISDAGSGLFFAKAGLQSACLNVRTNVINISDSNLCKELLSEIKEIEIQANLLEEKLWQVLKDRGGLPIA